MKSSSDVRGLPRGTDDFANLTWPLALDNFAKSSVLPSNARNYSALNHTDAVLRGDRLSDTAIGSPTSDRKTLASGRQENQEDPHMQ